MSEAGLDERTDLYEDAPCGLVSLTADGRIAKVNRTFAAWIGRTAAELAGQKFTGCLGFGSHMAYETHLLPMLRMEGRVSEIALEFLDAHSEKLATLANAVAKVGPDGKSQSFQLAIFKAGDRRAYERSLIAARDKAETTIAAQAQTAIIRDQFIAVLGHDLRNPLAAITSCAHFLERETLSERGRMFLGALGESASRAVLLTNNILDFARGQLGEGIILDRNSAAPLGPVLEQVVNEVRFFAAGRMIETRFAIDEPVDCDRQRLGQLAANLVSNAVTHGADDQPIVVEARSTEDRFILTVSNGGPPIPAEAQAQLFQPFFRGGTRPSQQGLGLGLFIVSEIARAHGGAMSVTSDDERTSFIFSMPVVTA